jgi:hypothetical protein
VLPVSRVARDRAEDGLRVRSRRGLTSTARVADEQATGEGPRACVFPASRASPDSLLSPASWRPAGRHCYWKLWCLTFWKAIAPRSPRVPTRARTCDLPCLVHISPPFPVFELVAFLSICICCRARGNVLARLVRRGHGNGADNAAPRSYAAPRADMRCHACSAENA